MTMYNELLISAGDAEALASVVGDRRRSDRFEADAADALAVTYCEEPGGERRTVALVHPNDAWGLTIRVLEVERVRSLEAARTGTRPLAASSNARQTA